MNPYLCKHYTKAISLSDRLVKFLNEPVGYSFMAHPNKKDIAEMVKFNKRLKKEVGFYNNLDKFKSLFPKEVLKYAKTREKLEDRLNELSGKPMTRSDRIYEMLQIFKKDPAFKWVKEYSYCEGTMLRALSDCSSGADDIYTSNYNLLD